MDAAASFSAVRGSSRCRAMTAFLENPIAAGIRIFGTQIRPCKAKPASGIINSTMSTCRGVYGPVLAKEASRALPGVGGVVDPGKARFTQCVLKISSG